jgi:formylglycine-generating enzyme required for sulfatase activity
MFQEARPDEVVIGDRPGTERLDSSLQLKLCWCPPGKFVMGSPPHEEGQYDGDDIVEQTFVTISRGFWMGKVPVTQKQWREINEASPSEFSGDDLPVEKVSWEQATSFCQKLNEAARTLGELPTGWEYRLPTEAQWEYACRADWSTAYCFGNDAGTLGDYAWYEDNSDFTTQEVGKKKPNAWGLCDMHGNVWEWCRDWYAEELPGGDDPEATTPTSHRVVRGGCWLVVSGICRSASRSRSVPDNCFDFLGLRVALVQVDDFN